MPNEEWDTESGLMSDYEGTVVDSYWSKNNQGVLYLGLKLATDNPDRPETEERFSTGRESGWDSFDGGMTAESKRVKKFNENSAMGKLINKVRHVLGDSEVEKVLGSSPRNASIWVGTKWFFEDEPQTFPDRNNPDGPNITFHQNYPTKFLGKDSEVRSDGGTVQSSPSTSGTPSPNQTTPPSSNGAIDLTVLGDDARMLEAWAKAYPHPQFADKVLDLLMGKDLLGKAEGDMIVKAAADENGLYAQLKG